MTNIEAEIDRISQIQWNDFKITLNIPPKATSRPRVSINGIFYSPEAKAKKKYFNEYIFRNKIVLPEIITTPIEYVCECYFPIPISFNSMERELAERKYIHYVRKPDFDNLGKSYTDILNKVLIWDDSLIFDGRIVKWYSIRPRVEISLRYMSEYDAEVNRNKTISEISKDM